MSDLAALDLSSAKIISADSLRAEGAAAERERIRLELLRAADVDAARAEETACSTVRTFLHGSETGLLRPPSGAGSGSSIPAK